MCYYLLFRIQFILKFITDEVHFILLTVDIPSRFNRTTMYDFIDSVITDDMKPKDNEVTFSFNNLTFIEPSGVTILSNLIEWLNQRDVNVILSYPKNSNREPTKGIKYLDDSNFFKHYLGKEITENANVRNTTIPIKLITYDQSYMWLEQNFIIWLSSRLNIKPDNFIDIIMSFGEIFNNIRDHANEKTGCIFAQHYPNKNQINISISDFGIGIPDTIRREYPWLDDEESLLKAIEEGVTSKSTPKNRGAGLKTLLENVVVNYGGTVQIRSYSGILSVNKGEDNEFVLHSKIIEQKYPGTFIEIILNTSNFVELNDEEEFEWNW